MSARRTLRGEHFVLLSAMIAGSSPILIHSSVKVFPPIFFAAASQLLSVSFHAVYLAWRRELTVRLKFRTCWQLLTVALCIVVVPSMTMFIGTQWTSGINTALLGQTEVVFTYFICGLIFREAITGRQLRGAAIAFLGVLLVLFHRSFALNAGDLLIVFGAMFYPFGNVAARRALERVSPSAVLAVRALLGGSILLLASMLIEGNAFPLLSAKPEELWRIVFFAFVILFIEKLFWYHGLKRLPVTKGISLLGAAPACSLILATVFLGEIPTILQFLGFLLTLAGLRVLTRAPLAAPEPL